MLLRKRLYTTLAIFMLVSMTISIGQVNPGKMGILPGIIPAVFNFLFAVLAMEYFVFYRIAKIKQDLDLIKDSDKESYHGILGHVGDDELGNVSSFINTLLEENASAQKKVKRTAELYHSVVDEVPFLVYRFKPDGTITFVNHPYARAQKKTKEELLGQNIFKMISEVGGSEKRIKRELSYLRPEAPVGTSFYDSPIGDEEKAPKWAAWINQAFYDEYGRVSEYQAIGLDIYQKAEEGLGSMMENFIEMVYFVNKEGKLKYVSPTIKEVLGHTPEDMVGKNFSEFLHDTDKELVKKKLMDHFQGVAQTTVQEMRIRNNKNEYAWIQTAMDSVYGTDGKVSDVAINARDITEVKQVGDKFSEIYENLKGRPGRIDISEFITEKSPVITLVWSPDEHEMRYISKETTLMLDYSKDELMSGKVYIEDLVHPEDKQRTLKYFGKKFSKDGDLETTEYRLIGKDGEIHNVRDNSTVSTECGKVVIYKIIEFLN